MAHDKIHHMPLGPIHTQNANPKVIGQNRNIVPESLDMHLGVEDTDDKAVGLRKLVQEGAIGVG